MTHTVQAVRVIRATPFTVAIAAAFVVCVAWELAQWGGDQVTTTMRNVALVAFSALAFGCSAATALSATGLRRRAWVAITIGFMGWLVGSVVTAYQVHTDHFPLSPLADIGYLTLPVTMCVAWATQTTANRLAVIRPLLDALIIAAALFLVSWVLWLRNVLDTAGHTGWEQTIIFAYPVADMIMVTMAVLVQMAAPPERRWIFGVVTFGLIAIALADSAALYMRTHQIHAHTVSFIGWITGLVLMSTGAVLSRRVPESPDADHTPPRPMLWLPYLPMPFAVAAGLYYLWKFEYARPVLVAAAVMVAGALIRQITVLTENRRLLDQVSSHAFRDPLTGLANRLLFTDRLQHAVQLRQRDGRTVAVLSLDLDDFKMVNDNLGHHAGDALLREIARRLVDSVPDGDTVARLGGDEFAIIMEAGPEPPEDIAQRVVEAFDQPFSVDGEDLFMHPSVGLSIAADTLADDASGADDLLKHADVAMYAAKRSGIGGVQFFTPGMQISRADAPPSWSDSGKVRLPSVSGVRLLGELRRVIEGGHLRLVYQPKISLATGTIVGVEALVRWPHPDLGLLTPNQFLPLIRRNGLMGALTDLVLAQSLRDASGWYRDGHTQVPVAINLFAPSFNDTALPERISTALADNRLPPSALIIEITEHFLLANVAKARSVIDQLRASGLRVSIDDFGSGYATMSYLRDLPIDELKLDRHFIAPILTNPRAAAIVRSVIDLTHALGITSVAEGVEHADTVDRLRDYGCDIAQGNYFAEPMFVAALRETLAQPIPATRHS